MAKSREKIQQLGFWDCEVSKPDHDKVCLWAYENAEMIFKTVCPNSFDRDWDYSEISRDLNNYPELLSSYKVSHPRPNPKVVKKILECVLTSYSGYENKLERIVGYADLVICTQEPEIYPQYLDDANQVIGCELGFTSKNSTKILVEVKSVLPTLGELMRQIQLYRTAFRGKFVVVSPDDSYKLILEEQEVFFIKANI